MEVKTASLLLAIGGCLLSIYAGSSTSTTLYNQICHNCWSASDFYVHFNYTNFTYPINRETECWDLCSNVEDCQVAAFDQEGLCWLYNSSQINQKIVAKTYRKTNNSDCLEYEIYVHSGYKGSCPATETNGAVYTAEQCFESCLERPSCRGATYDDILLTCYKYDVSCSVKQAATNNTFIQRQCIDDQPSCVRSYTQTCFNCGKGSFCLSGFENWKSTKPLNISTLVIGQNQDVQQIWYSTKYSSYNYLQCSYVTQSIGDVVFRATCTEDCPMFEVRVLPKHSGTCTEIDSLEGGVTLDFCFNKCLDMRECRGVTFNTSLLRCAFHNCDNYTSEVGCDFIARHCIDNPGCASSSAIIQTCIGCSIGPNCPNFYEQNTKEWLYTNCYDMKASDNESIIVHYDRSRSRCKRYQCSQVQQEMGDILYRQSCNTDCPKFEILQMRDQGGSCEVIYSEEGGLTFHYCVEKCLDISGCRGTTFNETTGRCDYHTCENHTTSSGVKFMWKRCIDDEPQRGHLQICVGCQRGNTCQDPSNTMQFYTWKDCETYFKNSSVADMFWYNTNRHNCRLLNCSLVEQNEAISKTVFRKSPSSDCRIFRLFTLYGYNGTCPAIGYDEGGVDLLYCIEKCLDMDGCRSVSHDKIQRLCFYHNCTERAEAADFIFVKRECMTNQDLDPIKNYLQTCKNCDNQCKVTVSTQPDTQVAYNCDTNREDCANVVYDPLSDICSQYTCDRPYIQGPGTTMFRRTTNPDCLHLELIPKLNNVPNCDAFDFDEGVDGLESSPFCTMRCLDIPRCLSVLIDPTLRNCTYHGCTDYLPARTKGVLLLKKCSNGCPFTVTQTCLNCQQGSLCQTPLNCTISSNGDSCRGFCEAETFCEGALYNDNNLECKLYQCSFVTQQFGAKFYRESCNDDCPIYEIYILEGYTGACDVISTMTEYLVLYPEICYQRCLDTSGCRSVTYSQSKEICYYHTCDCYTHSTAQTGDIFMWKYCLKDVSDATFHTQAERFLNDSIITGADVYPTATNCKPKPIYVLPCLCSTGELRNMTNEEIVQQLINNLTIDAHSTSKNLRKLISIKDNRPSSIAAGSFGFAILVSVVATVFAMDLRNLGKTIGHVCRRILILKRIKKESKGLGSSSALRSTQDRDNDKCVNSLVSINAMQHLYADEVIQ